MGFWDDKKPKPESFADKEDIKRLEKELNEVKKTLAPFQQREGSGKKVMKVLARGFGDIAESMNEPDSKRRPRIARMMSGKPPIARSMPVCPVAGKNAGIKRHSISYAPKER